MFSVASMLLGNLRQQGTFMVRYTFDLQALFMRQSAGHPGILTRTDVASRGLNP